MRQKCPALLVAFMAAAAPQPPCQASWDPWRQSIAPQPVRHLAQRGGDIGEDAAAEQARRATGGRVLSVRKGKRSYRVKVLLPGGRVRTVAVDSRSGRLLD